MIEDCRKDQGMERGSRKEEGRKVGERTEGTERNFSF